MGEVIHRDEDGLGTSACGIHFLPLNCHGERERDREGAITCNYVNIVSVVHSIDGEEEEQPRRELPPLMLFKKKKKKQINQGAPPQLTE